MIPEQRNMSCQGIHKFVLTAQKHRYEHCANMVRSRWYYRLLSQRGRMFPNGGHGTVATAIRVPG